MLIGLKCLSIYNTFENRCGHLTNRFTTSIKKVREETEETYIPTLSHLCMFHNVTVKIIIKEKFHLFLQTYAFFVNTLSTFKIFYFGVLKFYFHSLSHFVRIFCEILMELLSRAMHATYFC
jgi:hypothetical protein